MNKIKKAIIRDGDLQSGDVRIPVGTSDWFAWLGEHTRFSYAGKNGHFTAQRETRRKKAFWYGYRRRAGKLYKQYLGKSEELTAERLDQAGLTLAGHHLLAQYAGQTTGERGPGAEARIDTSFLPMSKITIPALPLHFVPRPRLARQINTPLALIFAPSGFGKTTLLNDWARSHAHAAAWLSLDVGDNQLTRFWYSVILALQTVQAGIGKDLLPDLRAASAIQPIEITARLTNDIVNAQAANPDGSYRRGFCLVLDDFHHITDREIYASLQTWLEHFPANLQLVIAGHNKPPLSLGRLRGKGFITELDANDLRFTLEEGIHFLKQHPLNPPLAQADLEKLVKHTEGWAAGLTLAAIALSKQENRRQFIDTFSGAHIYLREYFMETVMQRLSPAVQTFLLKTAILKHLNGRLCDAVINQPGSDAMLAYLWEENVFLAGLEEPGWYRYHDLFAEMLHSQLQARFPDEMKTLHQRAAQWYREQDAPADAIYHLLAIEAWEEAAALMEAMALRELEQYGEDSRLLRWLQELPEDVVQKHKTLLFVYLRLADVALPEQKVAHFLEHIETILAQKSPLQQTQDEREVLAEIQRIRHTREAGKTFTPPARDGSENDSRWELLNGLHLLKKITVLNPEIETQMTALLNQAQAQRSLFVTLMVGGELARRAYLNGQLRRGEKIARQVIDQALLQRGTLPETASIALGVLSQISIERNELEAAQRYLAQALEVDPNPTSTNMIVQLSLLRAKIQATQGMMDEALATMRAIRDLHARRPSGFWVDRDLLAYEAWFSLRKGDILSAERLVDQAEGNEEHVLFRLVRAGILLQKKQAGPAAQQYHHVLTQYPKGILNEPILDVRVQLALAQFEQQEIHQALQEITEAVRLAAPERFIRPFLDSGPGCIPLLRLALQTERLSADARLFIKDILRSSGYTEDYSRAEMEALSTSASISQREKEIIQLLSSGDSNRAMAKKLSISESTVKTHLRNIYEKLGANSRTQAVKRAKELHLLA